MTRRRMAIRRIKDIIDDLRTAASDNNQDFATLAEKTNERATELEAILAKEKSDVKFFMFMIILSLLFTVAFAIITHMSNDDLREDVTQKKEIINKFEQTVTNDTVYKYSDQKGNELTIPSLLDDNIKLMNKISNLEADLEIRDIMIKDIEARYGIKVINENNTYRIEGGKADSAMMLLPSYKDRLSYDSVKHQWIITKKYVKIGDKTYPE